MITEYAPPWLLEWAGARIVRQIHSNLSGDIGKGHSCELLYPVYDCHIVPVNTMASRQGHVILYFSRLFTVRRLLTR